MAGNYVALSIFVVANGKSDEVRAAFSNRPHLVDHAAGFCRMEVMNPVDNPEEFWLITYWDSEQHFRDWHRSHAYHQSHAGIPGGLKLVPNQTRVRYLQVVSE